MTATRRFQIAARFEIERQSITSQDRFKKFLKNVELSSTKTNAQKAHKKPVYFPWGHEVDRGVRA